MNRFSSLGFRTYEQNQHLNFLMTIDRHEIDRHQNKLSEAIAAKLG